MDELIYYNAKGNIQDKKHSTAFSYLASLHTTKTFHQYRQSPSSNNGSVNLSIGHGSHLLVALPEKPIMHVYLYGKESPEQIIPLPEILTCLTTYKDVNTQKPILLLGGSISGKLYIWSLNSGLLLTVKQAHYQPLTQITSYSGFIATGSQDSRIVIYTINSLFMNLSDNNNNINDKPFAIITDHTLPITSLIFNKGLNNDIKLISSSLDSTVRIYSLTLSTKVNLITTIVSINPISSLTIDPAFRSIYLGLNNGQIRCVPLFKANPRTKVIEAIGGLGKIITLKPDIDYIDTITCHVDQNKSINEDVSITQLKISLDGTLLISGDKRGSLFVIDITTKQIRKKLKELVGEITNIELWTIKSDDPKFENITGVDKSLMRSIPVLKRSICEQKDLINETLTINLKNISPIINDSWDLQSFLNTVQQEEKAFTNFTNVNSATGVNNHNTSGGFAINIDRKTIKDLKKEVEDKTTAYDELKSKYDTLLAQYTDTISNQ
jgi:pre-rRNA-processing protein IPI3